MKYFVINGFPRSGKDTFCNFCIEYLKSKTFDSKIISTIDFVKEIAIFCGWNGEKTNKDRKFLSDLKDLLTNWNDVPFKATLKTIDDFKLRVKDIDKSAVFIMSREPNEIARFKKTLNAKTILIDKEIKEKSLSNHADREVLNFSYNFIIKNNLTLEHLKNSAELFCNYFII